MLARIVLLSSLGLLSALRFNDLSSGKDTIAKGQIQAGKTLQVTGGGTVNLTLDKKMQMITTGNAWTAVVRNGRVIVLQRGDVENKMVVQAGDIVLVDITENSTSALANFGNVEDKDVGKIVEEMGGEVHGTTILTEEAYKSLLRRKALRKKAIPNTLQLENPQVLVRTEVIKRPNGFFARNSKGYVQLAMTPKNEIQATGVNVHLAVRRQGGGGVETFPTLDESPNAMCKFADIETSILVHPGDLLAVTIPNTQTEVSQAKFTALFEAGVKGNKRESMKHLLEEQELSIVLFDVSTIASKIGEAKETGNQLKTSNKEVKETKDQSENNREEGSRKRKREEKAEVEVEAVETSAKRRKTRSRTSSTNLVENTILPIAATTAALTTTTTSTAQSQPLISTQNVTNEVSVPGEKIINESVPTLQTSQWPQESVMDEMFTHFEGVSDQKAQLAVQPIELALPTAKPQEEKFKVPTSRPRKTPASIRASARPNTSHPSQPRSNERPKPESAPPFASRAVYFSPTLKNLVRDKTNEKRRK
ncbi:hypothetical protein PSACC_01425 [Paramicrosporidium saccamoebae]|uniref:FecR protein domain-containing protein n=1 Tax=Paramicrosporidium saccamoebae TaxID=1246581 RepID=A0A2H9TLX3_9FUNG|nr:hypothetical protein PSACC_01425 [Paramicrosporidium saccamoebae]